jgi:hypothetical protein
VDEGRSSGSAGCGGVVVVVADVTFVARVEMGVPFEEPATEAETEREPGR